MSAPCLKVSPRLAGFALWSAMAGALPSMPVMAEDVQREFSGDTVREAPQAVAGEKDSISSIDDPSPYCYQPDPRQDTCFADFYYLNVTAASAQYMIFMEIILNQRVVLYDQGFFQTAMYLPGGALGGGFRVACGPLGAGGNPDLGNAYSYETHAKDTAGLTSVNYGTLYCPAFQPTLAGSVIAVSPASLTSDQAPGVQTTLPLSIGNDAPFDLYWTATPTGAGCTGPGAPWVSIASDPGVTAPAETTDVSATFSSAGLDPAIYQGHLCVASGDTVLPAIDVPLTLKVHNASYPHCYALSTVTVNNLDVTGNATREACVEIDAGPAVTVMGTGNLTLRAGQKVSLQNGFEVRAGGRFKAVLDPVLNTP